MSQRTFSIIKPDAFRKGYSGAILAEIEKAGFNLVAIKRLSLSKAQARGLLRRPRAAAFLRFAHGLYVVGTDPRHGARKRECDCRSAQVDGSDESSQRRGGHHPQEVCRSIEENAIHGSDGEETAAFEIGYFFAGLELV